jgi:hypothetical protein
MRTLTRIAICGGIVISWELACYLAVMRYWFARQYAYCWAGGVGTHKGPTRRIPKALPEQVATIQAKTRKHAQEMSLWATIGNPLRFSHGRHTDKIDPIGVAA